MLVEASACFSSKMFSLPTPALNCTVFVSSRPRFPTPMTFGGAFVSELDLSSREPVVGLLELLSSKDPEDAVGAKILSYFEPVED